MLPNWRTVRTAVVLRDSGLPSGEVAVAEVTLRFAYRLRSLDLKHPLVSRQYRNVYERGRYAGALKPRSTRLLQAEEIFPDFPRPVIRPPRFAPGAGSDPTLGADGRRRSKKRAAREFEHWYSHLDPNDAVVFTDGSEAILNKRGHCVGYG